MTQTVSCQLCVSADISRLQFNVSLIVLLLVLLMMLTAVPQTMLTLATKLASWKLYCVLSDKKYSCFP